MSSKIKVMIVDDSALIRQMLTQMLGSDPDVEVVGAAPDPIAAQKMIGKRNPDVLTLDIEMPGIDGLTFLEKLMRLRPMPVVMISTLTQKGAEATVKALELGAVDVVGKPTSDLSLHFGSMRDEIINKVKAAATAKIRTRATGIRPATVPSTAPTPSDRPAPRIGATARPAAANTGRGGIGLIAIGASTGGVIALREVLARLPHTMPPIVVAQHMPLGFTANFASRLDMQLPFSVVEASDETVLLRNRVHIAPGNRQTQVVRRGFGLALSVRDDPPVGGHRPSVDVLFGSVAETVGDKAIGIILTGMGRDGASGLLAMRQAGASTIGQAEATCVVYGMPRSAKEAGAVTVELPLNDIAAQVAAWLSEDDHG